MSKESWLEEFYPISAEEMLTANGRDASSVEIIAHSLRKWKGLTKENLAKHGIDNSVYHRVLCEVDEDIYNYKPFLDIDADSCSLCQKFINSLGDVNCIECPLYKSLGNKPCYNGPFAPYVLYDLMGDPQPMIDALQKCVFDEIKRLKSDD
jgi:hypothetical protein